MNKGGCPPPTHTLLELGTAASVSLTDGEVGGLSGSDTSQRSRDKVEGKHVLHKCTH